MTKNELIRNVARRVRLSKEQCESVIDAFAEEIKNCLVRGEKILLTGFMSFEVTERPEHIGKDLKTGKITTFPPVKTVKCRPSKAFKDAVNEKELVEK